MATADLLINVILDNSLVHRATEVLLFSFSCPSGSSILNQSCGVVQPYLAVVENSAFAAFEKLTLKSKEKFA
jgi:hypothetical protein